jgi:hypothetical protein
MNDKVQTGIRLISILQKIRTQHRSSNSMSNLNLSQLPNCKQDCFSVPLKSNIFEKGWSTNSLVRERTQYGSPPCTNWFGFYIKKTFGLVWSSLWCNWPTTKCHTPFLYSKDDNHSVHKYWRNVSRMTHSGDECTFLKHSLKMSLSRLYWAFVLF